MNVDTSYALIRAVDRSAHGTVLTALASAFDADPLAAWLFPEPSGRAALQTGFYRSLLDHPGAEGHLAGDDAGAAIWLHLRAGERLHDDQAAPPDPDAPTARLHAVGTALAARHPVDEPHLYLAVMGVAPDRQGRGIGTALLRHRLEQADRDGIAAYLEASSPRSRDLYRKHGFTDLGAPVRLADAPPLYPMRRPATTSPDRSDNR
ncbi:GNAT family N-acetyltransferase [Glycomyces algeriensis]|uniref:N-acetyltransferase n=1 Tax=Glycomyces algeriensis TaxID=256037 RepID=A0A9W6LEA3_9ACTN|nr:GNAT family N-acetyltransferase [Glycomyces algeriensis]MDA1367605.1 GNAT family N-acetyltransferase [Glycomyces algeriensis]MDR7353032.1 GNAT superfamily N-acetyltransferase [Glycomyces algeriensis]GLI40722.1 N-acetyltransferase [Glycomyces algeriensis]